MEINIFDLIGLDADDMLWNSEILYFNAKREFRRLLSKYQDPDQVGRRLDEIEVHNIRFFGYGIKSFTLSMIETSIDISAGQVHAREISEILELSKAMLTNDVQLFEHAEETVARLSVDFDLVLIAKGDQSEQERKVERSGLAEYFRYIEVVGEKTSKLYKAIQDKYHIDPARFLMIGNSLQCDILPVIAFGGKAVYIANDLTWFHESQITEAVDETAYHALEHLGQLPAYLEQLR